MSYFYVHIIIWPTLSSFKMLSKRSSTYLLLFFNELFWMNIYFFNKCMKLSQKNKSHEIFQLEHLSSSFYLPVFFGSPIGSQPPLGFTVFCSVIKQFFHAGQQGFCLVTVTLRPRWLPCSGTPGVIGEGWKQVTPLKHNLSEVRTFFFKIRTQKACLLRFWSKWIAKTTSMRNTYLVFRWE